MGRLLSRLRSRPAKKGLLQTKGANMDEAKISLFGLDMVLKRKFYLDTPHEVSLFVPRAEIRQTTYDGPEKRTETEMILNSITIVHAPRHPLAGETGRPAGQKGNRKAY
jgi:hypothetical protein